MTKVWEEDEHCYLVDRLVQMSVIFVATEHLPDRGKTEKFNTFELREGKKSIQRMFI